jgi:hypothetical protein
MVLVLVTVIVVGLAPQSNVTVPPPTSAASRAASVQLSGVPVPTMPAATAVVGCRNARASRAASLAVSQPFQTPRLPMITFPPHASSALPAERFAVEPRRETNDPESVLARQPVDGSTGWLHIPLGRPRWQPLCFAHATALDAGGVARYTGGDDGGWRPVRPPDVF